MAIVHAKRWQTTAYGGPDKLELEDVSLPTSVDKKFVRIRVSRTTATYTDLMVLAGNYTPRAPLPVTPGYDLVGVIIAVGDGVTSVAVGDVVAAMPQNGGLATVVDLPEAQIVKIRNDVNMDQAVCVVLTGITAYQMLHRASAGRLTGDLSSKSILVHGCAGGTGAMLVALARLAGVGAIIGTCSAKNLEAARASCTHAIDYAANGGEWAPAVRAAAPAGVDCVFDAVMVGGYLSRGLSVLRRGGKYIGYGLTNTAQPGSFNLSSAALVFMRLGLQNAFWSFFDGKQAEFYLVSDVRKAKPEWFREDLGKLVDLVAEGKLTPADGGRVWPFSQASEALRLIAANQHRGKQVINCEQA